MLGKCWRKHVDDVQDEIILQLIDDSYDRYEELLIRKDVLRKEAVQYEYEYVKEFGDLISDAFKAKLEAMGGYTLEDPGQIIPVE